MTSCSGTKSENQWKSSQSPKKSLKSFSFPADTDLVVFSVRIAAAVLGQDAALAVEHVAQVALAALHAVLAAVPLAAGGGALGRAHRHAAGVMAVRRTALDWEQKPAGYSTNWEQKLLL